MHTGISLFVPLCIWSQITHGTERVGKLNLSSIGLGTWAWGNRLLWQYDQKEDIELSKVYKYCISNGINWFDTADSYGTGSLNGRSEQLLGQFSQQTEKKSYILTKLAPYPWRIGKESMKNAAKASINRLGKSIDILQLHWPPTLQWQERVYLESFTELVDEGKASMIGLSNYGPKGLERALSILVSRNQYAVTNQVAICPHALLVIILSFRCSSRCLAATLLPLD
jgi:pyridoxine 4-dehydrogenase